jgi:mannose/cellobiose epimerase-like protein (N-acyl-D-glucosamine 2-epimerase family)
MNANQWHTEQATIAAHVAENLRNNASALSLYPQMVKRLIRSEQNRVAEHMDSAGLPYNGRTRSHD